MKAVRIHEYGDASVLKYEDAPRPEINSDDVLIRVVATSVNPVDWKIREGYLKGMLDLKLPFTLGLDVSGVVEEVGSDVSEFKVGDEVYSRPDIAREGTYAEYVAVRASEVARKPSNITHEEAASLPLAGITAWESLFTNGGLEAGQKVLIHGAAGGVGSLAAQFAKAKGAYVIGTASARNAEFLRGLGVDEIIDYKATYFEEKVKDVDVVFDTIGGDVQKRSWQVLKKGGILVSITDQPDQQAAEQHGVRSAYVFIGPNVPVLNEITALVEAGKVRPVVSHTFALADTAKAHEQSQTGHTRGKIVITTDAK